MPEPRKIVKLRGSCEFQIRPYTLVVEFRRFLELLPLVAIVRDMFSVDQNGYSAAKGG
jgi:hypothetical protein